MDSVYEVQRRGSGKQNDISLYGHMNDHLCIDDSRVIDHSNIYSTSNDMSHSTSPTGFASDSLGENSRLSYNENYIPSQNFNFDLPSNIIGESQNAFSILPVNHDYPSDLYSPQNNFLPPLSYKNQSQLNDRSRRYGHRFETPILYQLQMDSDLRHDLGLDFTRQVSAPNLSGENDIEQSIFSSNHFDPHLLHPGYRYSTPLIYSSEHLSSPPSMKPSDETAIQSTTSPSSSYIKHENDSQYHQEIPSFSLSSRNTTFTTPSTNKQKNVFLPPGENNPDATPGANLCYDYLNKGICERQKNGDVCHYRHLDSNHPDAIADRFKNGLLSPEEIAKYKLRKCEPDEVNPFAPVNAKICYDFLNKRVCSRTTEMKICRYRHLLPNHPDAIADRERSSKRKLSLFGKV